MRALREQNADSPKSQSSRVGTGQDGRDETGTHKADLLRREEGEGKELSSTGGHPRSQILVQLKDLIHDESCTGMD